MSADRHTPEWLEEIAERLYQSDTLGADGIAYALEWAAADIRLLEKKLATTTDRSEGAIVGLRIEIAKMDGEIMRLKKMAREEGAWS